MKTKFLFFISLILIFTACVDDFKDANPPRLLDAPAVGKKGVTVSDTLLTGGGITTITVNVVDAPAGIASAKVVATDKLGIDAGGSFAIVSGLGTTRGNVVIEYTTPLAFAGKIDLLVTVLDGQLNEKGEPAYKSSVGQTVSIDVVCGVLSGSYTAVGTILVDDFGSGPYNYSEIISLAKCDTENEYAISDISGGLYANAYATNYGTSARAAVLLVDASNVVTWAAVSDMFGGTIIQDPAQPASNYDAATRTFTIYWTATAYGERGITVLTK